MSMDIDKQYDKIYRYCYYKLGYRESAEDVTQETFLHFFRTYEKREQNLQLLYTIARNLCIDAYRKRQELGLESAEMESVQGFEDTVIQNTALHTELRRLSDTDRELLLLRYVNDVPLSVLCRLYDCSRFALYRRRSRLLFDLKQRLEG